MRTSRVLTNLPLRVFWGAAFQCRLEELGVQPFSSSWASRWYFSWTPSPISSASTFSKTDVRRGLVCGGEHALRQGPEDVVLFVNVRAQELNVGADFSRNLVRDLASPRAAPGRASAIAFTLLRPSSCSCNLTAIGPDEALMSRFWSVGKRCFSSLTWWHRSTKFRKKSTIFPMVSAGTAPPASIPRNSRSAAPRISSKIWCSCLSVSVGATAEPSPDSVRVAAAGLGLFVRAVADGTHRGFV